MFLWRVNVEMVQNNIVILLSVCEPTVQPAQHTQIHRIGVILTPNLWLMVTQFKNWEKALQKLIEE
jgi:hypothetical protein